MIVAPGAYDAMSARLIEAAGFPAVYVGSYATSASRLAQPDIGICHLGDMVAQARQVVQAVSIPVISDAENGFNKPANIWRTVREFEDAGVSGIHIEDQLHGKHTSMGRKIRPLDELLRRIEAAVAARRDPNFLIIARTDAGWVHAEPDEAITRMNACLDVGADIAFPAGIPPDRLRKVRHLIKGKVMIVCWSGSSRADEIGAGVDIVLYYHYCLLAAYRGIKAALPPLRDAESPEAVFDILAEAADFERFIDYEAFTAKARKFGLQ